MVVSAMYLMELAHLSPTTKKTKQQHHKINYKPKINHHANHTDRSRHFSQMTSIAFEIFKVNMLASIQPLMLGICSFNKFTMSDNFLPATNILVSSANNIFCDTWGRSLT